MLYEVITVVSVGDGVKNCQPGDNIVIFPVVFDHQSPQAIEDYLYDEKSRIWGYETNFGAFADYCLIRATQVLPKPKHLSWAEAAVLTGGNSTVYRMLVSPNGAQIVITSYSIHYTKLYEAARSSPRTVAPKRSRSTSRGPSASATT